MIITFVASWQALVFYRRSESIAASAARIATALGFP